VSEEAIQIIRRRDDVLVDAKFLGGLQPQDLLLIERDWTVKRQEILNVKEYGKVSCSLKHRATLPIWSRTVENRLSTSTTWNQRHGIGRSTSFHSLAIIVASDRCYFKRQSNIVLRRDFTDA